MMNPKPDGIALSDEDRRLASVDEVKAVDAPRPIRLAGFGLASCFRTHDRFARRLYPKQDG